jgi:hypothetical protein
LSSTKSDYFGLMVIYFCNGLATLGGAPNEGWQMYTVEKDGELWLILKSGAPHIAVKDAPTASVIAAMLNAFAQAGVGSCEADRHASCRL